MKKFNKFDRVIEEYAKSLTGVKSLLKEENAVADQKTTYGIKVGSAFRLLPAFFSKGFVSKSQKPALTDINSRQYDKIQHYFKIIKSNGNTSDANVKSANNQNRLNMEYTAISADPSEKDNPKYSFIIPASAIDYIDLMEEEIASYGGLLPILAPSNAHSKHNPDAGKPTPVNDDQFRGLDNSPTDRSLPVQNSKL